MSDTGTGNHLDHVYASKSPEETAKGYDRWAETYDQDMGASGYRHPTICLALLARYIKTDNAAILDAGAGTGLIGEWLRIIGYRDLVALDASPGMLEVARRKGVYDELHQGFMGQTLPFEDDRFTGAVSAGVFTLGRRSRRPGRSVARRPQGRIHRVHRKGSIARRNRLPAARRQALRQRELSTRGGDTELYLDPRRSGAIHQSGIRDGSATLKPAWSSPNELPVTGAQ